MRKFHLGQFCFFLTKLKIIRPFYYSLRRISTTRHRDSPFYHIPSSKYELTSPKDFDNMNMEYLIKRMLGEDGNDEGEIFGKDCKSEEYNC